MLRRISFVATVAFAVVYAADCSADDPPAAWNQAYVAAREKHLEGDYAGAETALEGVITALSQRHSDNRTIARILAEYASIQQDLGRPGRAEDFYRRALAVWARLGPVDSERMMTLYNLATLYIERRQYSKAEQLVKEVANAESTTGRPALGPEMVNLLGLLAQERHDFKEAERLYLRSIELSRNRGSAPTEELGSALVGLAKVYFEMGQPAAAAVRAGQALTALESAVGPQHPELITPLLNMAFVKRNSGDAQSAEPFARRALDIAERSLGATHPHTADALLEYSRVLRQLHRKRDARKLESRAHTIVANSIRNDPSVAYSVDTRQLAAESRQKMSHLVTPLARHFYLFLKTF